MLRGVAGPAVHEWFRLAGQGQPDTALVPAATCPGPSVSPVLPSMASDGESCELAPVGLGFFPAFLYHHFPSPAAEPGSGRCVSAQQLPAEPVPGSLCHCWLWEQAWAQQGHVWGWDKGQPWVHPHFSQEEILLQAQRPVRD